MRKRWRRFRANRRAWWSLWLLAALYGMGLAAELICNDRPLYVRYNGRSFFPVFKFYPEHTFVPGGTANRPDYRELQQRGLFSQNGNCIIFPPVPYSPYESLAPDSLPSANQIVLTLKIVPQVGSVDVFPDGTIARGVAAGQFFATADHAVSGLCLTNYWILPPAFRTALDQRFSNAAAPSLYVESRSRAEPSRTVTISLSRFTPRPNPPPTARIIFRSSLEKPRHHRLVFDSEGRIQTPRAEIWKILTADQRMQLGNLARQAAQTGSAETQLVIARQPYHALAEKPAIRWPHPPVRGHWLGIDSAGRDVFARILYGLRTSLTFGLLLVIASLVIGSLIGALQGYYAGMVDITAQRLIEIWSALPFLYVMILLGSIFGPSFALLLLCYGIFNWITISYYMRAEFLRLRHMPFVEAAICMGVPPRRVIRRHILPNALTPIITLSPFALVGAIESLAALDYLGFGLPPPAPSWGELLQQAQQFRWAWWLILYPSLALFVVILLGVFLGEGIRDAFDPKPFSKIE